MFTYKEGRMDMKQEMRTADPCLIGAIEGSD